jgi:hypothetical protein
VVCSFANYSGNGRRIAFRNVLASGYSSKYSYNYIDDINLSYGCPNITLPYSENFDGYTTSTTGATGVEPDCWELVHEDVTMPDDKRPQIYYNSSYAHSGDYSLAMNYRGIYAMPALADLPEAPISQISLEMYVRQPRSQYMLEVGVLEDDGTFVPVDTVNNSSTGVKRVVCSFEGYSGNGHRIAFHNILASGYSTKYSYNYIDDINITRVVNKGLDVTDADADNHNDTDAFEEMAADRYLENVTLYPNPTTGLIHIDAEEVQRVECYTMMGQKVAVFNEERDIDISRLPAGVYMFRITMPQGEIMRKVVRK